MRHVRTLLPRRIIDTGFAFEYYGVIEQSHTYACAAGPIEHFKLPAARRVRAHCTVHVSVKLAFRKSQISVHARQQLYRYTRVPRVRPGREKDMSVDAVALRSERNNCALDRRVPVFILDWTGLDNGK